MADKDDIVDDVEENQDKQQDKHNWGAAELEKVTDHTEDKDDAKVSSDALGKLIKNTQNAVQKVVHVKKDDLQMLMNELELPKAVIEKKLIECNGNPVAALKSLLGC
ncbi:unnamed protein product [Auanema sp. JU1783]|nr:unnamed protein product [Auanema sp. JU1783]